MDDWLEIPLLEKSKAEFPSEPEATHPRFRIGLTNARSVPFLGPGLDQRAPPRFLVERQGWEAPPVRRPVRSPLKEPRRSASPSPMPL